MELLLTIICISALIGFVIGVASGYMLATLGTTNQKTGVFSDKMDRAVETEGFSRTVEFSQREESSSTSSSSSARVTGEAFVTPYGSVYHSRRNCGKLKAAKTVGKFYLVWSAGMTNHQRSMKIVSRSPLNGNEFLKTWLRCQVSSPRKGVWNCIVDTWGVFTPGCVVVSWFEFSFRFLDRSCDLILTCLVAWRFGHVFDTWVEFLSKLKKPQGFFV